MIQDDPSSPSSPEKSSSRPMSVEIFDRTTSPLNQEKIPSRPNSAEQHVSSRPTSPQKPLSRPTSAQKIPSRPSSADNNLTMTADNVLQPDSTKRHEELLSQVERVPSRPSSATKPLSRPSTAEEPPSRPQSVQNTPSRPPSATKPPSRPPSAEKTPSPPSSRERPSSAEKKFSREGTPERLLARPSSAQQQLPAIDGTMEDQTAENLSDSTVSMQVPPEDSSNILVETIQGSELMLERPSSKEGKKKRSSRTSVDQQPVATSRETTQERMTRPTSASKGKRVSISNVVEEKQIPMENREDEIDVRVFLFFLSFYFLFQSVFLNACYIYCFWKFLEIHVFFINILSLRFE